MGRNLERAVRAHKVECIASRMLSSAGPGMRSAMLAAVDEYGGRDLLRDVHSWLTAMLDTEQAEAVRLRLVAALWVVEQELDG